ncbi:phosphate acyltransferase [Amylibacter kogurei]|uniref:Phosphate acyltransferase n=1 Tax=Paramylibacter kogurei TaxID=1889778 RepID=A0A2G5K5K4_9RHOB|nr:phosphate acyltransferase PlsX [Amylibacter kogurei]PIB24303.1 phosphate acyltransferase [Amylibacter kogurei]
MTNDIDRVGANSVINKSESDIVISVDAMGGDRGAVAVVGGLHKSASANPDIRFIVHGDETVLKPLIAKRKSLTGKCDIRHAESSINMNDKPSLAMRNGKGTSMWNAIDSVKNKEAAVTVSCGNTGALMAISMLRLRKAPGVYRPAIAVLWPSRNPSGFNVVLDMGADVRADAPDLLKYALMGASYARNGLGIETPRVGLLNVGTEEHKGRTELKEAHELITESFSSNEYEFVGFIEGSDLPSNKVDVIVTDGFTGNVALKTGEGTANLISDLLKEAFRHTPFSRIGALFSYTAMQRLKKRIDPRRVNGGVFLGLNGTVIKSHGDADATGVAAAIQLGYQLAKLGFSEKLAARVASAAAGGEDT